MASRIGKYKVSKKEQTMLDHDIENLTPASMNVAGNLTAGGAIAFDGITFADTSGNAVFGGTLTVTGGTILNGDVDIGNGASDEVGFYGTAGVAQSSAYTATTQSTRNADSATLIADLQDVVQTLIADLKLTGIIG